MSVFSTLKERPERAESRTPSALDKRAVVASRLASRMLSSVNGDRYSISVKGGRLGIMKTFHDTKTYDLVAQKLEKESIEIKVHNVSQISPLDGKPILVTSVMSLASLKGFPRYLPLNPVEHPHEFAKDTMFVSSCGDYIVEQVYPPPLPDPVEV